LAQWVPAIQQIRTYERAWLGHDVAAGLVLTALLVPAGMAYAQASGLPAITGLYATLVPLVVYAIFGPSRILVVGPDSSLTPLIFAAVVPLSSGDPARAVALAGTVAVLAGVVCLLAGLARFGFLSDLLSAPVRYGYLNGIALTIAAGQLPKLFGFSVSGDTLLDHTRGFGRGLTDGLTEPWALAIGAGTVAVIVGLRHLAPRVPGTLLAVVGSIVLVRAAGLADHGVQLVGRLPGGLPRPSLPVFTLDELSRLFGAALGIAFVAFADTSVLSRVYALRRGTQVDADQELVALGLVNVAAGFFQGFAVSGSQSRTPVADSAGARTQLTGIVAAATIVVILVAAPGVFQDLPAATLAGVVVAAATRLVTVRAVARLAAIRRSEFVLSLAAFVSVAVLGVIVGVAAAIALSLLNFMRRAWMPHTAELVRVDGLKGYHDAGRHPEGHRIPGLLLYRFDAPLFFANARFFVDDLLAKVDGAPSPVRTVVVTAEPMTDVDTTAADAIQELVHDLDVRGATLHFAEMKGHVRERLGVYGLLDLIGPDHFPRTTGEAVRRYVVEHSVDWVDWEDRDVR
jgi:high affinity sulfate transporter 1